MKTSVHLLKVQYNCTRLATREKQWPHKVQLWSNAAGCRPDIHSCNVDSLQQQQLLNNCLVKYCEKGSTRQIIAQFVLWTNLKINKYYVCRRVQPGIPIKFMETGRPPSLTFMLLLSWLSLQVLVVQYWLTIFSSLWWQNFFYKSADLTSLMLSVFVKDQETELWKPGQPDDGLTRSLWTQSGNI